MDKPEATTEATAEQVAYVRSIAAYAEDIRVGNNGHSFTWSEPGTCAEFSTQNIFALSS